MYATNIITTIAMTAIACTEALD